MRRNLYGWHHLCCSLCFIFDHTVFSLCISLLLHDTRGSKRKNRNRKRHFLKRIKNNGGICLYVSLGCRRVIMWHMWIIMTYKNKNLVYIRRNSFPFQVKSCLCLLCSLVKVTLEHCWKQNKKEFSFWEWCPSDETVEWRVFKTLCSIAPQVLKRPWWSCKSCKKANWIKQG